jgi:putative CocE/NonD family hydrolase
MNHPNYDAWWQARNPRNFVSNIKPAMMVVGGTFDAEDCFGAWNLYKALEEKNPSKSFNKIVMGPWFHGAWGGRSNGYQLGKVKFGSKTSEWYQQNIEIPFFQYYLKGKGNTDAINEANIFFTGKNEWQKMEQWPSKNVAYKNLYLLPNHGLSFNPPRSLSAREKPSTEMTWTQYTSDPNNPVPHESDTIKNRTREYMTADQRFAQKRADVLYFETDTLMQDITLGGPLTADLNVSITGTDADFVVKLIDVFPNDITQRDTAYAADSTMNGYQMLVRGEIMRGRFRNSFEKPEPFVSNKITRVKFTMPDVAHTFLKGHRIMVQVQSSWFPLVDRNPQTFVDIYHAKQSDFKPEDIRIYHTEGITSKIVLPVLP